MNKELNAFKRQLILECASKYFRELGYEKTSIGKIARELEVGVGTIYSFFGSKEDLFAEHNYMVLTRIHANVRREVECTKEPMKKLEIFIRHKMDYFEKNRKILKDYIFYNFYFVQKTSKGTPNPINQVRADLADTIEEALDSLGIRHNDYRFLAFLFEGIVDSYIEAYWQKKTPLTSKVKAVLRTFLKAVR